VRSRPNPSPCPTRASHQGQSASLGCCASSGRAWRLWAARHSQRKKSGHWAASHRLRCSSDPPPESDPTAFDHLGGGRELLENASFTLTRGRIYALIGRNGKGKSTLLRALASRAVGDIPPELTVHYVSQEVNIEEERLGWTPVQFVVHADVERRLLMVEEVELEAQGDEADAGRAEEVREALVQIEAATAKVRATSLLEHLGFSPELRGRPMTLSLSLTPTLSLALTLTPTPTPTLTLTKAGR